MSTEDLESAVQQLFPEQGKNALAAALGIDPSTLWRYAQRGRVPGPVRAAVASWIILKSDYEIVPPASPCAVGALEELAERADPGIRRRSGLLGIELAAFVIFGGMWKSKTALMLGIDYSTVWRQIANDNIQGPVMAAFRAWLLLKCLGRDIPETEKKPKPQKMPKYARLLLEDE